MSIRKATDIFGDWAKSGRDTGMEKNHGPAVDFMLNKLTTDFNSPFTFIDAGCGNGWVIRKIMKHDFCNQAYGVDGAKDMILKAKEIDSIGNYFCSDLLDWSPNEKVDFIHSMEVIYYFKNPKALISHMVESWLKPGGKMITGIDFYSENKNSHSWPEDLQTRMSLLSITEWHELFQESGFKHVKVYQTNKKKDFPGTLVIYGIKNQ